MLDLGLQAVDFGQRRVGEGFEVGLHGIDRSIAKLTNRINGNKQVLLVAMQIRLKTGGTDWRIEEFINELMELMDTIVRDYEPLARPAPAPEIALPEPGTKDIA